MARYHGRKGVVYLSTSGTGEASTVLALTNWTLNMETDKVDVTAFGDQNKVYVQGLKDTSGSIKGWWDNTEEKLFEAADSPDGVKMYLYPSADAPGIYWYGVAWLDASIEVPVDGAISVSANFVAKGQWTRVWP